MNDQENYISDTSINAALTPTSPAKLVMQDSVVDCVRSGALSPLTNSGSQSCVSFSRDPEVSISSLVEASESVEEEKAAPQLEVAPEPTVEDDAPIQAETNTEPTVEEVVQTQDVVETHEPVEAAATCHDEIAPKEEKAAPAQVLAPRRLFSVPTRFKCPH